MNPMDLKRGIDRAVEAVVKDIEARSKGRSTNAEIAQVGTISANGDREIGHLIAQAMQKVGKEGVITVEEGDESSKPNSTSSKACSSTAAIMSPYFVTNAEKMVAELDEPYILLNEKKLSNLQILAAIARSGRPVAASRC